MDTSPRNCRSWTPRGFQSSPNGARRHGLHPEISQLRHLSDDSILWRSPQSNRGDMWHRRRYFNYNYNIDDCWLSTRSLYLCPSVVLMIIIIRPVIYYCISSSQLLAVLTCRSTLEPHVSDTNPLGMLVQAELFIINFLCFLKIYIGTEWPTTHVRWRKQHPNRPVTSCS